MKITIFKFWYQYKGSVGVQSHEFVNPIFYPWTLSQRAIVNPSSTRQCWVKGPSL